MGDYMILVFTKGDALWKILIDGYLASIDDYLARNCFEPFAKNGTGKVNMKGVVYCNRRHTVS
ncbi:hypothetical protein OROMI_005016 [Orobanche minor]